MALCRSAVALLIGSSCDLTALPFPSAELCRASASTLTALSHCCVITLLLDFLQSHVVKAVPPDYPVEPLKRAQLWVRRLMTWHTELLLQQTCHTPLTVHDLLLEVLSGTLMPSIRGQAREL